MLKNNNGNILPNKRRNIIITIIFLGLFLLLVGFWGIYATVRLYKIIGKGMSPNFNNGMYVIARLINSNSHNFKRGDVVIYRSPNKLGSDNIGRVIAMPSERVSLESGQVFINGTMLDESKYLSVSTQNLLPTTPLRGDKSTTIPENQYLILGDNRSLDFYEDVYVSKENIWAIVEFCYWNCANN